MVNLGRNATFYADAGDDRKAAAEFNWTRHKRSLLSRYLSALPRKDKVVDVGCRDGRNAEFFKQACGIAEMHGVDIADAPLEHARRRGIHTARWISGESPFPAEDGSFDAVIAMDVIEHIYDTEEFIRELARVTRDDGVLLVTIPNLAWWRSRLRLLVGKMPDGAASISVNVALDRCVDLKHLRMGIAAEWTHMFESAGLTVEDRAGYTFDILKGPSGALDHWLSRWPTLAHSILYVLRKSDAARRGG
ncbi:bifunctional 2-polyprenyl-6-hydroxyphenol methylase/3-demethylubiquinol 3-O-methyltransferase UbiG [Ancylobacter sp. TS-1]|uniref:class I SAM-dependent methyltransferase n=1 Tax=Ancylobacter sp. TS-1 TaxID=1850374 RepID=UPI001265CA3B|nr:class I SAM-dependent methyltransferase [Ancylobacter sp. TS-1]QFR32818.1 methyltransferase domain-containing protein [Ancylobacter sp. TS-1]